MGAARQNSQALIMVVDDNNEFLIGIKLTLEMEGFKIWTAINGQDALDGLHAVFSGQTHKETGFTRLPDLILSDIMMPVMDGYDFYSQVRDDPHLHHIPFIFLTAKSSDKEIRLGKELGADDYLSKLNPLEDVLASIRGKLKRVEQQRFFDLMAKRAEERQQATVLTSQPDSNGNHQSNNQIIFLVAVAIIIIVIIALIYLPL